jgi:hypothetical protein
VRTLRPLQAAAITYRIAFGPRAGRKVLTLRGATPREAGRGQPLCADIGGFSLHAAVRVEAHDRKRLEQLCRYITRPALSDERVQLNAAGQVELKLKTSWRDGTTHLVMSPLEFMKRPAALAQRPRCHPAMTAWQQSIAEVGCQNRVGCRHLAWRDRWPVRPRSPTFDERHSAVDPKS